jgi:hypothetical protein
LTTRESYSCNVTKYKYLNRISHPHWFRSPRKTHPLTLPRTLQIIFTLSLHRQLPFWVEPSLWEYDLKCLATRWILDRVEVYKIYYKFIV